MIALIFGSRRFSDFAAVEAAILSTGWDVTEIITGDEPRGTDAQVRRFAKKNGIPCHVEYADWDNQGSRAGPIRNTALVRLAQQRQAKALALWDGHSKGTQDTMAKCRRAGVPLTVLQLHADGSPQAAPAGYCLGNTCEPPSLFS